MSAIAGIINLDGAPVDRDIIQAMMDTVRHRGPDGEGQWISGSVGLAYMHLATTPESLDEVQPVVFQSSDVVLVWDGRIDNRPDLITAIGNSNNISESSTDSTLVMSAYLKWGAGFVTRIAGDYAFGIWDNRSRTFLCGRDPVGIRLIHYYVDESKFVFGTEIKQLLAHPGVSASLDTVTMGLFLAGHPTFGDRTFYSDIRRLPGGNTLALGAKSQSIATFWDPDPDDSIRYSDPREYAEHFRSLLTSAVISRTRSYTPVEILLSGGLDSGSIASIAGFENEQQGSVNIRAQYWRPPVSSIDEEPFVDAITGRYDILVNKIDVSNYWAMRDPENPIPRDEPFTLPFEAMNCEGLRQASGSGARSVLTGEGGDEAFTPGYMLYLNEWARSFKWVTLVKDLAKGTKSYRKQGMRALARSFFPWRGNSAATRNRRIPEWITSEYSTRNDLVDRLYASRVLKYRDRNYVSNRGSSAYFIGGDQRAAAFGVELRHPFWDSRVVEFMVRIPPSVRVAGGRGKVLLKQSMTGILPEVVLKHQPYGAFGQLFDRGFRNMELDRLRDLARCQTLEQMGIVDGNKSRRAFDSFISDPKSRLGRIFWALQAEDWLRGAKFDQSGFRGSLGIES